MNREEIYKEGDAMRTVFDSGKKVLCDSRRHVATIGRGQT
jgi:hypothetical protein